MLLAPVLLLIWPMATSRMPSLLKSPTSTEPVANAALSANPTVGSDWRMGKKTTLETPPPGVGFTTVIEAVPIFATSAALMMACRLLPELTIVTRGDPFQLSAASGAKPVPVTFRRNSPSPGAMLAGTKDWFARGTGFVCPSKVALARIVNSKARCSDFMIFLPIQSQRQPYGAADIMPQPNRRLCVTGPIERNG